MAGRIGGCVKVFGAAATGYQLIAEERSMMPEDCGVGGWGVPSWGRVCGLLGNGYEHVVAAEDFVNSRVITVRCDI